MQTNSNGAKTRDFTNNSCLRYNAIEERLEVCLGVEHIPVGPLTRDQRELAKLAATQAKGQEHKIKGVCVCVSVCVCVRA